MDLDVVTTTIAASAGLIGAGAAVSQLVLHVRAARRDQISRSTSVTTPDIPIGDHPDALRGRRHVVDELRRSLRERRGNAIILVGASGFGKSSIAAEFARYVKQRRGLRRTHVWWVHAAGPATLHAGMADIARRLGAPAWDVEAINNGAADAPNRLWDRLNRTRSRWLLVIDNADDPAVLARTEPRSAGGSARPGPATDGTGWLRPTRSGMVLVTSQLSDPGHWGRNATVLPVEPLAIDHAAQVLLDHAPHAGDVDDARALAGRLGCLPLALCLVGRHLGSGFAFPSSFHAYLAAFDDPDARSSLLATVASIGSMDRERMDIMRTWEISLDALNRRGTPEARPLLRLLSCYASATPIPLWLLVSRPLMELLVGSVRAVDRSSPNVLRRPLELALYRLHLVGLIGIDRLGDDHDDNRAVTVHPLIADTSQIHLQFGRGRKNAELVRRTAVALIAAALADMNPDKPGDWPRYLALLPHVEALFDKVAHGGHHYLPDLVAAAVMVSDGCNECGADRFSERLMVVACNGVARLDEDDPLRLTVDHHVTWPVAIQGRYAEAEGRYRRVHAKRLSVLGPESPDTVRTRHELAWISAAQFRWAEAESEYRHVLELREKLLGEEHRETLITKHELGWSIARQHRPAEARTILLEVLEARERILGKEHSRTLQTRQELAWILGDEGHLHDAEVAYRQLLEIRERELTDNHRDTLVTRHELAWVYALQGRTAAAIAEYEAVLDARRLVHGEDHRYTVGTRQALDGLHHGRIVPPHHLA